MNGSDYPLPAINWIYRTSQWKDQGYITDSERESLNQIYHYNPLLFDFVSKRTLHHPKTGMQLRPEIFICQKYWVDVFIKRRNLSAHSWYHLSGMSSKSCHYLETLAFLIRRDGGLLTHSIIDRLNP